MLYKEWIEKFYQWLFKKKLCEHDYKILKRTSIYVLYEPFYYKYFKCSLCGKKKKEPDFDHLKPSRFRPSSSSEPDSDIFYIS